MKEWLSLILLAAAAGAHAAPPASAEDDVGRFMAEKKFVQRLDEVRASVGDKVSEASSNVASKTSELVVNAMGFLGVPYRRGGSNASTGFDCSGFVKAMYEQTVGLILPRRANEQAAATQKIDRQDLQPGDLVFFNTMKHAFSHVGIYVGDGKFIHSPKPGAQVRVEDMGVSYWKARFDGARRVLTGQPPAAPAPAATAAAVQAQ
ncbi:C40 family peptidase [Ramlibacter sp. G-1-2-2]|uniref:C40 family peptidase n=1 Tax=Ramlibacter agri TaxID=2728837 RepID=A0A848HC73_9BURK|nr:C40 family peptidase [Ramlibacter agri]NML48074.1 C40 family peptidase [Ramlibacter agri]